MSPASQGSLEVERYIGSNLISSCARINNVKNTKKNRKSDGKQSLQKADVNQIPAESHHRYGGNRHSFQIPNMLPACGCSGNFKFAGRPELFGAAGWTGVPLISVASDGKKKNQNYHDLSRTVNVDDDSTLRTPLSRLAIHTQGAPLILTGRCYNGRKNQNKGSQVRNPRGDLVIKRSNKYKDNHSHGHGGTSDCLSVASDESSGSGHSENCLPRIIKPRKRRKKDRKPSIPSAEIFSGEETNINVLDNSKNLCDKGKEVEIAAAKKNPQQCDINSNSSVSGHIISNGSQLDEGSDDETCGPKLHHTFEDVSESEIPSFGCLPSSCQCHYCDPSGIWDAPSNFFPNRGRNSSTYTIPPLDSSKSFHYFSHSDLALRRSWSEPMPDSVETSKYPEKPLQQPFHGLPLRSNSFTETKLSKLKDWTGDTNCGKIVKTCTEPVKCSEKSNGDKCDKIIEKDKVNFNYGRQCLEVSTEIVTSPNGHRDLEIRFYSTSPP